MVNKDISPEDQEALHQLVACSPHWVGQITAAKATGCEDNVLLHAGPAFANAKDITAPILNSARVAAVYQGLASDFDQAKNLILQGEIILQPAQNYSVATPLASVVSMSMPLHQVSDANNPTNCAFAPINGGNGPAMRLGICNDAVLEHLRWLNDTFSENLWSAVDGSMNPLEIAKQSLLMGDDCHGRTVEATKILGGLLAQSLDQRAREFINNGPSFFLNLWMASVRCMFNAAEGVQGSSLITTAGANGRETGICISAMPDRWFTAPAGVPNGGLDVEVAETRKLGAIGDSAVVDALGLGAMAMNFAPAQKAGLGPYMPEGGLALPSKLLGTVHPGFGDLGLRVGMLARNVVDCGQQPVVSLGVLDNTGELGRLGGGIFSQPMEVFQQAVSALG